LIIQTQRCYSNNNQEPVSAQDLKKRKRSDSDGDIGESGTGDESTVTTAESPISTSPVAKGKAMRRSQVVTRSVVSAIVTRIDLLEYIAAGEDHE